MSSKLESLEEQLKTFLNSLNSDNADTKLTDSEKMKSFSKLADIIQTELHGEADFEEYYKEDEDIETNLDNLKSRTSGGGKDISDPLVASASSYATDESIE